MKRIVALVGVRGAGKTTLFRTLDGNEYITLLKPTTDRPKRAGEEEYEFVEKFPSSRSMAWKIRVGTHNFGVRKKHVTSIPDGFIGVTVFDPGSIGELVRFRDSWKGEVITVGLDTIATVEEQNLRVEHDAHRVMNETDFLAQQAQVQKSDIVLRGGADVVLDATLAVCEILASRGGLVGKNWLTPLIRANALLDHASLGQIEPASYDLRLGNEVWCQGQRHPLTEEEPFFSIPPYSYAIVKAEEIAKIPRFMAGRFDLTVSLFFKGVLLSNGPQVDPGYDGALFCTLFNGRDVHAELKLGAHFATIEFCTLGCRVEGYIGDYQGKVRLNEFLGTETGSGPGGNIVGRVQKLEKESRGRFIAAALAIAALIGGPSMFHLWIIDSLDDRAKETLEQIETNALRDAENILEDLSRGADEASTRLSDGIREIDEIEAKIDEVHILLDHIKSQIDAAEEISSDGPGPGIAPEDSDG